MSNPSPSDMGFTDYDIGAQGIKIRFECATT